ncbi:MAG: SEC-C domain-containing protein, partial [Candidatus Omnitrophica bacterium]|nr:SEC-C domain-containing protein [Candidatus Omnitrophota bacterium]
EHLRSIDELREGIHLRAYGQVDPLVEYQRESFAMFEQLTASIKDEVVEFLFKVQAVREEKMQTVMNPSQQQFLHPEAGGMTQAQTPMAAPQRRAAPGGMMDPGGRGEQVPETYRRDQPKVGRNDPCPCGSGKKYKKCHGA